MIKNNLNISFKCLMAVILFCLLLISSFIYFSQDSIYIYLSVFVGVWCIGLLYAQYIDTQCDCEDSSSYTKDELTGLNNRYALEKELACASSPNPVVVDIDEFGKMNDCYGKEQCDEVLRHVTAIFKDMFEAEKMHIFRIGADQFAILEDKECDVGRYETIAESLVNRLKGIYLICNEHKIEINCTIGFSLDKEMTLQKALMALNSAKENKRDYFCYFENINKTKEYMDQVECLARIKDALKSSSIVPFYQAIYDRDGKIAKYECLIRMINSDGKIVSPLNFLGASYRFRLYTQLEKAVIDKAFAKVRETKQHISINILARDMIDNDVSKFIFDKLREYDIAEYITVELVEEESIEVIDRIQSFFARLKRLGVKIAIDDFGTGYSNFSYLLKLRPDYIKIDGSLIKHIDTDQCSYEIVKAIVAFSKELKIKVIAEYVHSKEVYEKCYELGVDEFQGYYLGEPKVDM